MEFVTEHFTEKEKAVLSRYFTNTDRPVFALINLPDVVKGALFARYSRYGKSLRRLFLDEFYDGENVVCEADDGAGARRAGELYDKMILDFGDDSVAQLGGAHLACEQVSNIMTKMLERGRLAAYLEQSTRYIYYNEKVGGCYRYAVPDEIVGSDLEQEYRVGMDGLFEAYSAILDELLPLLKAQYPQGEGQGQRAWEATIRAKACDIVRGLLPSSTRSNLGIYADGQAYEYMLVKMFADTNAEVRRYADLILEELRKVIPSFLTRVDLEERGRLWSRYISDISQDMRSKVPEVEPGRAEPFATSNEVTLTEWDAEAVEKVVAAALYEYGELPYDEALYHAVKMSGGEKEDILRAYAGNRTNRRHKPGRAFEHAYYTFEVVSDYGAFRDLQRHRILTIEWQKPSIRNGYIVPRELEQQPRLKQRFHDAVADASELYEKLRAEFGPTVAQYAVPFAARMRYLIKMNLREAFHFIELRSQKQGHYSYRNIAIEMAHQIRERAGHGILADLMKFVDTNPYYDLSREDAENKKDMKLK